MKKPRQSVDWRVLSVAFARELGAHSFKPSSGGPKSPFHRFNTDGVKIEHPPAAVLFRKNDDERLSRHHSFPARRYFLDFDAFTPTPVLAFSCTRPDLSATPGVFEKRTIGHELIRIPHLCFTKR